LHLDIFSDIKRSGQGELEMDERGLSWLGSSYKDLMEMPDVVRGTFGHALGLAQNNL